MAINLSTNFNQAAFLKKYWQKKPLLLKQVYAGWQNPLPPDQLIKLAGHEQAEARVILEHGGRRPWELKHGPFKANLFKKLPASHWTLLVQGTNHYIPALQLLLEDFYFIPQWRIEDIMTSFAVKDGSVGAHVDNYDVFLLQAQGQREWRISDKPLLTDDFLPDHEVKLLRHFKADKTFILNPGDMLYLPPRFAHHGIALTDDCVTHSIGFRAPNLQELLDDYLTHLLSTLNDNIHYSDKDLMLQKHSGEISAKALHKVSHLINKTINNKQQLQHWFGRFITQNKYTAAAPVDIAMSTAELVKRIAAGEQLLKNPAARFAYIREKNKIFFYANGEEYSLPGSMLFAMQLLTAKTGSLQAELPKAIKHKKFLELLVELTKAGCFYFK